MASASSVCPKEKINIRAPPPHWWTKELRRGSVLYRRDLAACGRRRIYTYSRARASSRFLHATFLSCRQRKAFSGAWNNTCARGLTWVLPGRRRGSPSSKNTRRFKVITSERRGGGGRVASQIKKFSPHPPLCVN